MKIVYSDKAAKQFRQLDKSIQKRIKLFMDEVAKLENPRSRGKILVGDLSGFLRYRVGDYRILCKIRDKELYIFVVEIGHRKNIYK